MTESGEIMKQDTKELVSNRPNEILAQGKEAATQLMELVKKNKWATKIGTKDHLSFEAWQTLGRFYGYTVKTVSTKYIVIDGVVGYEAEVVVLNPQGVVVGGAESMCMSDEDNWSLESHLNKWGKTVEGKKLYSLRSMAQTRAGARALRQMLSWVVVMAGYAPQPTEDMDDGLENTNGKATLKMRSWIAALIKQNKITLPEGKFCTVEESNLSFDEAKKILKDYKENALNKRNAIKTEEVKS